MSNNKDSAPTSLSLLNELMPQFTEVLQNLGNFRSQITLLQNQVKTLEKSTKRHVKQLEKEVNKRKRSSKKPSGFAQPAKISDKLCCFMERPNGTEMARTEVTKHIISYIKKNRLQNTENKRYINPDDKLRQLLGLNDDDELTYFNLQSYMNQHFIKKE